jgi:hypothetical protein
MSTNTIVQMVLVTIGTMFILNVAKRNIPFVAQVVG